MGQETAEEWVKSGDAKRRKRDWDGAITDYTKAIELNPTNASAYERRTTAKEFKGDRDGVIAVAPPSAHKAHKEA